MELSPFHLALPVRDLAAARAFYVERLGCGVGREAERWVDLDLFGHQVSLHLVESPPPAMSPPTAGADAAAAPPTPGRGPGVAGHNPVDGDAVPVPHFGVVLPLPAWRALAERLEAAGTEFVIPPRVRFRGEPGEQATLFLLDPSGNALEFKAFEDPGRLFAR